MTPKSRGAGPTDYTDPELRSEIRRAAVWIGLAGLVVLAVILAEPLLVIFGGLVFAAAIDGGARLLGRVLPIGRAWRVAVIIALAAAFLVWTAKFAGNQIADQAAQLPETVVKQALHAVSWLKVHRMAIDAKAVQSIIEQAATGLGQITSAVSGLISTATTIFLILVLGIYIAAEPQLYRRGIAWMMPMSERAHFHATAGEMGRALRRLMAGRMLGMVIEGVVTGVALAVYGVPMAALIGLLTGLLAFLPNIGAPISGAIMILVGFSGGTAMGVYCIVVYIVLHTLDGNLIAPYIARKTVDLPPALVLSAQLIMGTLFGLLGLALADPLVAMLKIALERHSARHEAQWHAAHPEIEAE
jgi:predicted PurR-regulated permease PerM